MITMLARNHLRRIMNMDKPLKAIKNTIDDAGHKRTVVEDRGSVSFTEPLMAFGWLIEEDLPIRLMQISERTSGNIEATADSHFVTRGENHALLIAATMS